MVYGFGVNTRIHRVFICNGHPAGRGNGNRKVSLPVAECWVALCFVILAGERCGLIYIILQASVVAVVSICFLFRKIVWFYSSCSAGFNLKIDKYRRRGRGEVMMGLDDGGRSWEGGEGFYIHIEIEIVEISPIQWESEGCGKTAAKQSFVLAHNNCCF